MSDVQFNILNRRSAVSGYAPPVTGLKSGELFIQMADDAILFRNSSNQIVRITTSGQGATGSFVTTGQTGNFVNTSQTGKFASLDGSNYLSSAQIPNITGDVCINAGSNVSTVYKIQGYPVANTQPANGQTLQFNGSSWVPGDIPAGGNGGGGLVYYFNEAVAADLPTGSLPTTYSGTYELGRTGMFNQISFQTPILPQATYSGVVGFITDVLDPQTTSIPAGLFDFNIWASSNTATQTVVKLEVYKYDGATTTASLLASSDDVYTYDGEVIAQYILSVVLPQTTISSTDRLYIRILAKSLGTNKNITFYFGGNTPSHVHTTIPSVGGSGLIKVINGIMQNPASSLVDADVSASAAIAGTKIQSGYFALASATGSFVTTGQTGAFAASGHTHVNFVTTGQTGVFALAANTGSFVTTGQTVTFNTVNTCNINVSSGYLSAGGIEENIIICSAATSGLINFDVCSSASMYYINNSTANFGLNLRSNSTTTINSILETNKTLTVTLLNTNGATGYALTGVSIDGTGRSIKWLNGSGSYPAGNTGSIDTYSITAVKTGNNLYTVFGSQGRFA